jgi:antitoxin component of MazEF toxin-antitoxin module
MTQLTLVSQGDSAAVVLSTAVLESVGLHVGDIVDVTVGDRQLILRSTEALRGKKCLRRLLARCSRVERTLTRDSQNPMLNHDLDGAGLLPGR